MFKLWGIKKINPIKTLEKLSMLHKGGLTKDSDEEEGLPDSEQEPDSGDQARTNSSRIGAASGGAKRGPDVS